MFLFDVNNFGPFNSDVWGSVSDWLMLGATVLTAIYLIRTFKSQEDVQRQQQTITNIEINRHRLEILPRFEVDLKNFSDADNPIEEDGDMLMIHIDLIFDVVDPNIAYNVEFRFERLEESWKFLGRPEFKYPEVKPSDHPSFTLEYRDKIKPNEIFRFNTYFDIIIEYYDFIGNKYKQKITYTSYETDHGVKADFPVLIARAMAD